MQGSKLSVFPLSWPQLSLWYDIQGHQDHSLYQLSFSLDSDSPIHVPALENALRSIGESQSLLKARIHEGAYGPEWVVPREFINPVVMLHDDDPAQREALISSWMKEALPLDGPLFAVAATSLASGCRLAVKWNHLVADGWSFGIIWREFLAEYERFKAEADGLAKAETGGEQQQQGMRASIHATKNSFAGILNTQEALKG